MTTRYSALLLGLLFVVNLAAARPEHETLVREAIAEIDWEFHTAWAFNETTIEDDIVMVGRFDPSMESGRRWRLLSFDNRSPSDAEQEAYLQSKEFSHLTIQDDNGDGLTSIVRLESLKLVDEGASYWEFDFQPEFDADDEETQFLDNLRGTLRLSKLSRNLQFLEIRNTDSIRPIIGAKISRLSMRFEFGETSTEGPWVLKTFDVRVQGSALLFVRFDEREHFAFSDFDFVGES